MKLEYKGEWAVLVAAENLLLISDYANSAVERLKQIVPPGARRFYRTVNLEFFAAYGFSPSQSEWLVESKLFNGAWELLREFRRPVLEALTLEYSEVWLVEQENDERVTARPPATRPPVDSQRFGLGSSVEFGLSWARTYSLYCHRHRQFETNPCKEVGGLTSLTVSSAAHQPEAESTSPASITKTKEGRRANFWLKAPLNTLLRAQRKQTSYYLAGPDDIVRLGRDDEGAATAQVVIESQRLALIIRAAHTIAKNQLSIDLESH